MAKLSSDKTYVTVEKGDTLKSIAKKYLGAESKYKQLAAINGIKNTARLARGQKIYLKKGSSSSKKTSNSNMATVTQFGLQNDTDNLIFAVWKWSKTNTDKYQVVWHYDTGNGHWFIGNDTTTNDTESTYSMPSNARRVRFRVKPISKTYKKKKKTKTYWTASWSTDKIYNASSNPPEQPSAPSVEIEKYKLTTELNNIASNATHIQFQIVKDNSKVFKTGTAKIVTGRAAFSCTVDAGSEYKVRCRAQKGKEYSAWSEYSDNVRAIPSAPKKINVCKAMSESSVYLSWSAVKTAQTYDIEYATKKEYFDGSDQTTVINNVETIHYQKTGLESGTQYFFRIRAVNEQGNSGWSAISSIVIGKKPAAPTTWSSTTTAVIGENLNLYWVHNSEDNSSQVKAELELVINGAKTVHTIKNSTAEDEKDKTSVYVIDTSTYTEGVRIQWRVRTAGITNAYGDWSIQRTIDIYVQPGLILEATGKDGFSLETIESFPFKISGEPSPNTQTPISYHLTITANEAYETVDQTGNTQIVNQGEEVYSKYFDISEPLHVEMSAGNVDLENNISYKITCVVSMDSGLTAESSINVTVQWNEIGYVPNAEISFDEDTYAAYIRPYCEAEEVIYYRVFEAEGMYDKTEVTFDSVYGEAVEGAVTSTGEQVYFGMNDEGEEVYYCEVRNIELVEGVTLSVYRREFDGTFTELTTGLENTRSTFVTDPHPALDYARYRIVAITEATGEVAYYDVPGYFVGETAVIIQWNEEWSNFDTSDEEEPVEPAWSGSLLRLPYNIDVSDNHEPDVSLIEYIGRSHPVSYYGTQKGETSIWQVEIDKEDIDTLYALRRLAIWMGDVYVREPSGSGYWANISVSFSQKHRELTIPVTFNVTRVEGGI